MRRTRGFTLIELMIVLTVAAIILAIAVPTFYAQLRKSRRSEIISQLGALALSQEQYRANNTTYATTANLTTFAGSAAMTATHYTITVTLDATNPERTYTLTATAKAGDDQLKDRSGGTTCTPLTLVSTAGAQAKTPTACWQ